MPGTFDCLFSFSLTPGAVTAALTRVYFAAIGQKFLQGTNIFVVNVLYASSAKTTLRLIASAYKARFSSVISAIIFPCHLLPLSIDYFLLSIYYCYELENSVFCFSIVNSQ